MQTFLLHFRRSVAVDMSLLACTMLALACSSEPAARSADGPEPSDAASEPTDGVALDASVDASIADSGVGDAASGHDAGKDADGSDAEDAGPTDEDASAQDAGAGDAATGDAGGGDASVGDSGDAGKDAGVVPDAGKGDASDGPGGDAGKPGEPASEMIWGVTVDDIQGINDITASLKNLAKKPTTRIVFDEFMPATYYAKATKAISEVSFVMGEILDSWYVSLYSPAEYEKRTIEYLDLLGDVVDIWEVGNEINGEWLCDQQRSRCNEAQAQEVVTKMSRAYDLVKERGKKAALTLYYNQGCYSQSSHEMFTWAAARVPERMKQGLDYVFVSYYEDDCNGLQPDWEKVFSKLAEMFPNSKLGFGECGTNKASKKEEYINRYYRMKLSAPRFVGGYFWWYFRSDMVPHTKPLWSVLNQAIADG